MDALRQTAEHQMAQLTHGLAHAQQQLSTLAQQIATLQAERDQLVQVVWRQQGALTALQELLATADRGAGLVPHVTIIPARDGASVGGVP